jgi:hypothetical protein
MKTISLFLTLSGLAHHHDDFNDQIPSLVEDANLPAALAGHKVRVGKKLKFNTFNAHGHNTACVIIGQGTNL